MNVIFSLIFIFSAIAISIHSPDALLKSLTDGASKSVNLCLSLVAVYTVWSGILQIAEVSGLLNKISKLLKPIINRLFKNADQKTKENISVNVSANLLGMGSIATPPGIEATTAMTENGDHDGACLLFILASTSLQILPTTIVSIRQSFNSVSPFDIFLPSLISTAISTSVGILLYFVTKRSKK
ncbi:MAG: hypothetical protein IKA61_05515 [Clostridia bacterium]|nr:hypothetical protein [Clostridia bacterium]